MKRALVTLAIGKVPEAATTFPFFRRYAERFGLDFIVMDQRKIRLNPRWTRPRLGIQFEKLQLGGLLQQYERILYADADILINPNAPDLIAQVPAHGLGVVFEDIGADAWKRSEELALMEEKLGYLQGAQGYFNSGVLVLSQQHVPLFDPGQRFVRGRWPEQTFLNYHARRLGIELHLLDCSFNFLPVFEGWTNPATRQTMHLVHYAGKENKKLLWEDAELMGE